MRMKINGGGTASCPLRDPERQPAIQGRRGGGSILPLLEGIGRFPGLPCKERTRTGSIWTTLQPRRSSIFSTRPG